MMRKLVTEFIGTFFLVLTIGLTVVGGSVFAPLAIGCVLMVMVYMGGHISGAHYNPAVSLAILIRGKMDAKDFGPYVGVQLLAAFVAAWVTYTCMGETLNVAPAESTSLVSFLLLEALFTFALALVVLNVATAKATEGNSYFGLAIGFTVLAGAFAVGGITGGAFNPAVAIGPIFADAIFGDSSSLANLWVYVLANFVGGALAAVVFKFQNPEDA